MKHRWRDRWWFIVLSTMLVFVALSAVLCTRIASGSRSAKDTLSLPTTTALPFAMPPPSIAAQAAYLGDPVTGTTLYADHADSPRAMASLTKIMTAVVALLTGDPAAVLVVPPDIASLDGTGAAVVCCPHLRVGERYTLRELVTAMLITSGDDAAIVIADGLAGSQSVFVGHLNSVAAWLGLTQTHFMNVHGLDAPGQVSTARDLAKLAGFAMTLPLFREIVAQPSVTIPANASHPAITVETSNVLLVTGRSLGVDGVKVGFTGDAGYCVILHASKQGRQLIAVVLGDANASIRFDDGAALLAWGERT